MHSPFLSWIYPIPNYVVHGNMIYFLWKVSFDIRNTGDPGNQLMKGKQVDVGIYRIKFTVYKTGNVHVCFVDRITGEERSVRVRNPLIFQKRVSSVYYRI